MMKSKNNTTPTFLIMAGLVGILCNGFVNAQNGTIGPWSYEYITGGPAGTIYYQSREEAEYAFRAAGETEGTNEIAFLIPGMGYGTGGFGSSSLDYRVGAS